MRLLVYTYAVIDSRTQRQFWTNVLQPEMYKPVRIEWVIAVGKLVRADALMQHWIPACSVYSKRPWWVVWKRMPSLVCHAHVLKSFSHQTIHRNRAHSHTWMHLGICYYPGKRSHTHCALMSSLHIMSVWATQKGQSMGRYLTRPDSWDYNRASKDNL